MRSVTGLHVYYYFSHLCDYLVHRTVNHMAPPITAPGLLLLLEQGRLNETNYVEHLRQSTPVLSLKEPGETMEARAARTLQAMRDGAPILHNGVLDGGDLAQALAAKLAPVAPDLRFRGETDLLFRVDGVPSAFGTYSYRVADVKSSRTSKFPQMMQVAYYDWLLRGVQGGSTGEGSIVVFPEGPAGAALDEPFPLAPLAPTLTLFLEEKLADVLGQDESRVPYHLAWHCRRCLWQEHCTQRAEGEQDLSLVAGLRPAHKHALGSVAIRTVSELAAASDDTLAAARKQASAGSEGLLRLREQSRARAAGAPKPRTNPADLWADLAREQPALAGLPSANHLRVHVDLRADPISGEVFGFAVQIGAHAPQILLAETARETDLVYSRFMQGMEKVATRSGGRFVVFHHGQGSVRALERLHERYPRADWVALNLLMRARAVDLERFARQALYLPARADNAVELAAMLGAPRPPGLYERLTAAEWDPVDVEAAQAALAKAAQRIGTTPAAVLAADDDGPLVWWRMHLEGGGRLWLRLAELYLGDTLRALQLTAERLSAGEAAHV